MKKLLSTLLSCALLTPLLLSADDTPLGKHMDEMSGHLKSIRRLESFPEKAAAVRAAQEELIKCFAFIPALTEKTTDKDVQAQQIANYKKLLAKNYMLLCDYELAFLAKDEDKADKIYRELKSVKKDGHTEYIEE